MTITQAQLLEWKALAEKATEGPWIWDGMFIDGSGKTVAQTSEKNGPLIAASRTAVPALVQEVERLRAAIDAMQEPTEAMLEAADRAMVGMLTETKAQRMACLRAGYAAAMKAARQSLATTPEG